MRSIYFLPFLLSTLCGFPALGASYHASDFMLGDWAGARTQLHDDGVDLNLVYTNESGTNLSGGDKHAFAFADEFKAGAAFNLAKLINLEGGHFYFAMSMRGGDADNLNTQAGLGELHQSLEIYGRGRVTRLSEMRYQQFFFNGDLELNLGRMNLGSQFGGRECDFMNLNFCSTQFNKQSPTAYNWPISQWAVTLKAKVSDQWAIKTGVIQHNPSFLKTSQGMNFGNPAGTQGMVLPIELQWSPVVNTFTGNYRLGYWYDSADQADLILDDNNNYRVVSGDSARMHSSIDGEYLIIDQQITSFDDNPARGISLNLYADRGDKHTTKIDKQLNIGMDINGPFASRPKDKWAVAYGYLHVNNRLSEAVQAYNELPTTTTGMPLLSSEHTLAMLYKVQLLPYLSVQPELQYIYRPGANSDNSNALVAALKIRCNF